MGRPRSRLTTSSIFMVLIALLGFGGTTHAQPPSNNPGYLGLQFWNVTSDLALDLGWERPRGAIVVWPVPGFPGEIAGLLPDDIIVALDGEAVESAEKLVGMLRLKNARSHIELQIVRDRSELTFVATLVERPYEPPVPQDIAALQQRMLKLYNGFEEAEATSAAEEFLRRLQSDPDHNKMVLAQGLSILGDLYRLAGRIQDAEAHLLRGISTYESQLGPSHPQIRPWLTSLANLYSTAHRYGEAENYYQRAILILEKYFGRDHGELGPTLHNYGSMLSSQEKRYGDAELLIKRSLLINEKALGPDHLNVAANLNALANIDFAQRKYDVAESRYRRSLRIYERQGGPESARVAMALTNLANMFVEQTRYSDAEALLLRALNIRNKPQGGGPEDLAATLNALGAMYVSQERFADAERYYKQSFEIRERSASANPIALAQSLNNLGNFYVLAARFTEAEALLSQSFRIYEQVLGSDSIQVATAAQNLGELQKSVGSLAEAERLFRRAMAIRERVVGATSPDVGASLNSLGNVLRSLGRDTEAEAAIRRSIDIREAAFGPQHLEVAKGLNDLALVYWGMKRFEDAEKLLQRAQAIREASLDSKQPLLTQSISNLAGLYKEQGRYEESRTIYRRVLKIEEAAWGEDHPNVMTSVMNLANLDNDQGRYGDAEPLYKRVLAVRERALGPDHPDVALCAENLGVMYRRMGRYADALEQAGRALLIRERGLGANHPEVADSHWEIGYIHSLRKDWGNAYGSYKKAASIRLARANQQEIARSADTFLGFVRSATNLAISQPELAASLHNEAFVMAQWAAQSEAATALARMSTRAAAGNQMLEKLVRERQDLASRWSQTDKELIAAVSFDPSKRTRQREDQLRANLSEIESRTQSIDSQLKIEFPKYAALSAPEALSLAGARELLRPNEALVTFSFVAEEGYVWAITPTEFRMIKLQLSYSELQEIVHTLRCGLDSELWADAGASSRCRNLLKLSPEASRFDEQPMEALPFDVVAANRAYKALFGGIEATIRGRHLLIVATGPLTQLPFQVLVTNPSLQLLTPKDGTIAQSIKFANTAWLMRRHAITMLPAVSSLNALRRVARPSSATKLLLGIGNPLLNGDPISRPWEERWAELARAKQTCGPLKQPLAGLREAQRGRSERRSTTRGGRIDLEFLRSQPPLHDTADELCAVAADLNLPRDDIILGSRATESTVKKWSTEGRLAQYRVLHFATHGAMAGQIEGAREPGLVLTPPSEQSEDDDGYLSASEISALRLDAEWIVLSACNTAAGEAQDAEALSGLATAFLYAGARSLLVSHWAVDSAATARLVGSAVGSMRGNRKIGRAEALRQAMTRMINSGGAQTHPALWAPFVVVGEGSF